MKKLIILFNIVFAFGVAQAQQGGLSCNAFFSYTIVDDISALTVQFTNQSTAPTPIILYEWDFDDGQGSAHESPRHQYLDDGVYIVSLRIITADGCTQTFTDSVVLQHTIQSTCYAFFSYYPDSTSPYSIGFTDHSNGGSDTITSWDWNFGDGSSNSPIQHPVHNFGAPGVYNVTLTITTSSCTNFYTIPITIGSVPPSCKANFSALPTDTNPLFVEFHDLSIPTNPSGVSYRYSFGDADTLFQRDPGHLFPYPGKYNVELRIEKGNCVDSITIPVMVGNPQRYNLWGQVFAGPYVIDKCIAYLYKNFQNKLYVPLDTVELTDVNDTLGVYYFYQKYEGEHIVKLLVPNSSNFSEDYISTYYGNSIYWQGASNMSLFNDISQAYINLAKAKEFDQVVGNGYLSGYVDNSANIAQQNNNVEVLLLNANGQPLQLTYTDASGNFTFADIPYGDYYLTSDITGLNRIPVAIQLNSSNDSLTNIKLFIKKQVVMGLHEQRFTSEKVDLQVFPNPTESNIHILIEESNSYQVQVYDMYGRLLISKDNLWLDQSTQYHLSLNDLPKGVYLLKLESTDKKHFASSKIIKQ